MMNAQELVHNHVLYEQNDVVTELIKHGTIPDESLSEEWYEVLEWWLVTPFLAELLRNESEIIIAQSDCYWWGRTCSGQGIYIDSVITDIITGFD